MKRRKPIDYDPDKDIEETGGLRGIDLANAIIQTAGGYDNYFNGNQKRNSKRISRRKVDLENPEILKGLAEIALRPFTHLQMGERLTATEIAERLTEIRRVGYPVKGSRRRDRSALWSTLEYTQADIRCLASKYIPEVLAQIDEEYKKHNVEAEEWR